MRKSTLLFIIIFIVGARSIASFDLYGEVSKYNRTANTVHYTKISQILYRPNSNIQGYAGLAVSGDSLTTEHRIYNDNYVAPLVGLKLTSDSQKFSLFSEYRYLPSAGKRPTDNLSKNDFRGGLVAGRVDRLKNLNFGIGLFNDIYSEIIFSSRLESNFFGSLSNKTGFEKNWGRFWTGQTYIEAFARRDSLGYYYENLQEIRLGLRNKFYSKPHSLTLSAHLANGSYAGREYRDPNPYATTYKDAVIQLIFGSYL